METINFRDFMDGSFKEKKHSPLLAFSVVPFTNYEPLIITSYVIIGVVGLLAIGGTIAEKKFMNREMYYRAEKVMNFVTSVIPIVAWAVILWALFMNPFMRWL